MGSPCLKDAQKRFDFKASGMTYDLRLISVTEREWERWQDELLAMVNQVMEEMIHLHSDHAFIENCQIFMDTERNDEEMNFIYCSDAGKVEVIFDFEPKTLSVTYNRMIPTIYETMHSLF